MANELTTPTDPNGEPDWPIEIRPNGTVIYDGVAIGGLSLDTDTPRPRLTLNLGWMRAADVGITIEGDPQVDRKRGGVVLKR